MSDGVTFVAEALRQAGDAIIAIDRDGIIRLWNEHAAVLFGRPEAEAVGQDVKIMIPERLQDAHDEGFFTAMARGHLASDGRARRTKGVKGDGSTVFVTMTFAVINGADGEAIGAVAVAREYVREG